MNWKIRPCPARTHLILVIPVLVAAITLVEAPPCSAGIANLKFTQFQRAAITWTRYMGGNASISGGWVFCDPGCDTPWEEVDTIYGNTIAVTEVSSPDNTCAEVSAVTHVTSGPDTISLHCRDDALAFPCAVGSTRGYASSVGIAHGSTVFYFEQDSTFSGMAQKQLIPVTRHVVIDSLLFQRPENMAQGDTATASFQVTMTGDGIVDDMVFSTDMAWTSDGPEVSGDLSLSDMTLVEDSILGQYLLLLDYTFVDSVTYAITDSLVVEETSTFRADAADNAFGQGVDNLPVSWGSLKSTYR